MTFTWPFALLMVIPVTVVAAIYVLQQRRRRLFTLRYSTVALLLGAAGKTSKLRRQRPAALYLVAMAILVIALARPQASYSYPASSGLVILAIDSSGSMNGTDVAPSRIDAAREA